MVHDMSQEGASAGGQQGTPDIGLGMQVRSSDGRDVGTIDRLILDPATNEVAAAVIHKGVLLSRDVEVPRAAMQVEPGRHIRLTYSADQIDKLPEFFEEKYTGVPPAGYIPPAGYPAMGMGMGLFWPLGYGAPVLPVPAATTATTASGPALEEKAALRQQDLEHAVIGEGSMVMSSDGETVGDVHRLTFDPASGELTHIVVRKGLIFTKDEALPATLIARVDDGIVYLKVAAKELPA